MEPGQEGTPGPIFKPFTPPQAKDIILSLDRPSVFLNMVCDWPALLWKVSYLSCALEEEPLRFRIGQKRLDTAVDPQFETHCDYVEATLNQFDDWVSGLSLEDSGPFSQYDNSEYWAYADYKYLAEVFKDRTEMLQDVVWADFGFPGRDGQESTIWIGSSGANTPCHLDTYGCNLVLQVEGRKTWHLFPPEDTPHMYPTRIPYEESSVFSKVNVINPDRSRFPMFSRASPHVVTLHPGQVLFVPRHWWHYVESIDDITVSVNSWIELDSDHEARVQEAVTRMLVCALKSAESPCTSQDWINPTEGDVTSHQTNLQYLNCAVSACVEHLSKRKEQEYGDSEKQDPGTKKKTHNVTTQSPTKNIPFGPHLISVSSKSQGENVEKGEADDAAMDGPQGSCRAEGSTDSLHTVCTAQPGQGAISTEQVLDCLVNPQVIRLVTDLLLQKQKT
ncbi:HSPB1-associated protein 1 [Discoglossus pictus]